jgi:spermidine dehydrogenase
MAKLGMGCPIARRDFIGGVAATATMAGLSSAPAFAASLGRTSPAFAGTKSYPPSITGLRGQYPGSFEQAHAARDGEYVGPVEAQDVGEHYDLVIVGAGISGLSAAYFYRKIFPNKKILILDNLDDFGGHAKRNELQAGGKTVLANGGTMLISTPFPYGFVALSLLRDLGIDPSTYSKYSCPDVYKGLGTGVFFDKENFGKDQTITGFRSRPWDAFFGDAPLTPAVRADLIRLYTEKKDHLPDMNPAEKAAYLKTISYQDFLLKHARMLPECVPFFRGFQFRNNMRVDTCPAFVASRNKTSPGFAGMTIQQEPDQSSDFFHFPDGNASIARLLVSRLVPGVFAGTPTPESIIMAPANYTALDVAGKAARIRLSSMVVRVEHIGNPDNGTEKAVRVVYVNGGKRQSVTAANVIMACYTMIIPFIVPDLPDEQKEALRYGPKVPMQYTNVFVRNWEAWKKLGIQNIQAPNGYHPSVSLEAPVSIGGYEPPVDPSQPTFVRLSRSPNKPGIPRKDQHRAGRYEMLATPFEKIEYEVRSQMQRMLAPGGFDAKRDILAITVNRWPHGYTYTYDTLGDPEMAEADKPYMKARRPFKRIAMAGSDMAGAAYTNIAIDQAQRAVQEVLLSRDMT